MVILGSLFTRFYSAETTLLLEPHLIFFTNLQLLEGTRRVFKSPELSLQVRLA